MSERVETGRGEGQGGGKVRRKRGGVCGGERGTEALRFWTASARSYTVIIAAAATVVTGTTTNPMLPPPPPL
eukprot:776987-Pleurochrysis_carterae.AAC.2